MTSKTRLFSLAACLLALASPAPLHAAKGANKPGKRDRSERPGMILKEYDKDRSGTIDGSEMEALRKAYEADKTGPLKKFDKDNDGTLSDTEIAGIKRPERKAGKGPRAEARKKKTA
jgi:Ca2+-binding EF-hand superfamily protein